MRMMETVKKILAFQHVWFIGPVLGHVDDFNSSSEVEVLSKITLLLSNRINFLFFALFKIQYSLMINCTSGMQLDIFSRLSSAHYFHVLVKKTRPTPLE